MWATQAYRISRQTRASCRKRWVTERAKPKVLPLYPKTRATLLCPPLFGGKTRTFYGAIAESRFELTVLDIDIKAIEIVKGSH